MPGTLSQRELLYRLILAEALARPGQGPLARRFVPAPRTPASPAAHRPAEPEPDAEEPADG